MTEVQLPLSLRLDTDASFDNYYAPLGAELAVQALHNLAEGRGDKWVYLHAEVGRSHLLQACALKADSCGQLTRYIPLAELRDVEPSALLEGCEELDLLCLDDIDAVIGDPAWERILFNCYNGMLACSGRLLVSSSKAISQLHFDLPDFRSRLQSFTCFRLPPMSDEELVAALQFRARLRGLEISSALAEFILARSQRDLGGLFALLNRLDSSSLVEKRKLTIPFVKQVMGW